MSEKIHLHLGIGALGLGLVCLCTSKCGFRVIAGNRGSGTGGASLMSKIAQTKRFEVYHPSGTLERIPLPEVYPSESADFQAIITDERTVLFTTCIKDYAYTDPIQLELITRLITARIQAKTQKALVFIACENGIKSSKIQEIIRERLAPELQPLLSNKIIFADCVVDRICNKPSINGEEVRLVVEDHACWLVENATDSEELKALFPSDNGIVRLVPNLKPHEALKRIIVNGAHLSTALYAHHEGYYAIDDYLRDDKSGMKILEGLVEELQLLFLGWQKKEYGNPLISDDHITEFADSVQSRLTSHPQQVKDATTRLKVDKLQQFFKDYHRKVGAEVLAYNIAGAQPLYYVPRALYMASEIIATEKFI